MKGYSKKGECGSELVSRQIEKQEDNGSKFTSPRAEGKNNFNMVNVPSRLSTFTKLNWIVCVRAGNSDIYSPSFYKLELKHVFIRIRSALPPLPHPPSDFLRRSCVSNWHYSASDSSFGPLPFDEA